METITTKIPFNAKEYARNYQRTRYNNDPVFKANQLLHVKKLYEKNKELDEQLIRSKSAMDQMIVYFKETIELQVIQTNLEIKQIAEIQLKKINSEIINDLIH